MQPQKSRKQDILPKFFKSIDHSLHLTGHMPWYILRLWGFLCIRDAGYRGNKITGLLKFSECLLQWLKKEKTSEASMRPPQRGDVPILNFKTGRLPYQGGGHDPVSVDYCIHDFSCCCWSFNLPLYHMLPLWRSFKAIFCLSEFYPKSHGCSNDVQFYPLDKSLFSR